MEAKAALREYARLIRVGSHALKDLLAKSDTDSSQGAIGPINELLFLLDRFEELAAEIDDRDGRATDKRAS